MLNFFPASAPFCRWIFFYRYADSCTKTTFKCSVWINRSFEHHIPQGLSHFAAPLILVLLSALCTEGTGGSGGSLKPHVSCNRQSNSGLVVGVGKWPLDLYHITVTFNCATVNCSWLLFSSLIAQTLLRSARYSRSFFPTCSESLPSCTRSRSSILSKISQPTMNWPDAAACGPALYFWRLDANTALAEAILFCLISSQFTRFLELSQITTSTMEAISDPVNPWVRFNWFSQHMIMLVQILHFWFACCCMHVVCSSSLSVTSCRNFWM